MSQATKELTPMGNFSNYDLQIIYTALKNYTPELVKQPYVNGLYGDCPSCSKVCQFGENFCSNCGQRIMFEVG